MAGDAGYDHMYVLPLFVTVFMRLAFILVFLEKLTSKEDRFCRTSATNLYLSNFANRKIPREALRSVQQRRKDHSLSFASLAIK